MAQRSHERAALAATKTFEGAQLRMPGNKADMTGAPHKATPALARSYTVTDCVRSSQTNRSVGLMDKASAPGAGDPTFESWADQLAAWLPGPGQHLGTRCNTHNARPSVKRAAHEAHRTDRIFPRLASVLEAVACPPCLAAPPMFASQ